MKLSETSLPSDPLILKAWNVMARATVGHDLKKHGVKMAEILSKDCAPDLELTAAILIHLCVTPEEAAKNFSPRIAQIVEILHSGDDRYRHLADPANAALPLAKEIKLALVASSAVTLKGWGAELDVILDNPELARMGVAFAKAAGEDAADFEDPKKCGRDFLATIHAETGPLLGTTGETKLEQRYKTAYNNLADLTGAPALEAEAAPAIKPIVPKAPGA